MSVTNKESFVEILKSCLCNFAPVQSSESEEADWPFMGYNIRDQDRRSRDGTFAGPSFGRNRSLTGGAEFKNWKNPLSPDQLSDVVSHLLREDLNVYVCMVPELSQNVTASELQRCISRTKWKTDWLVLHLTLSFQADASGRRSVRKDGKGIHGQAEIAMVKRKVLMIIEIGIDTQPLCGNEQSTKRSKDTQPFRADLISETDQKWSRKEIKTGAG